MSRPFLKTMIVPQPIHTYIEDDNDENDEEKNSSSGVVSLVVVGAAKNILLHADEDAVVVSASVVKETLCRGSQRDWHMVAHKILKR